MWNPFRSAPPAPAATAPALVSASDAAPAQAETADDGGGFVNVLAGLGGPRDKRSAGTFVACRLDENSLANMYRADALAGRIIDTPADDMFRKGWTRTWDGVDEDQGSAKKVAAEEERTGLAPKAHLATKWGRLYGGSLLVAVMKGANHAEPLVMDAIKQGQLARFVVWDRYQVTPSPILDKDPESPGHDTPLYYTHNRTQLRVHNSRVARFIGRDVPFTVGEQQQWWGDSIIQRVQAAILNFAGTEAGIAALALESNVDVIAMEGLREMLSTPEGKQKIKDHLEVAHLMKSIIHTLVIDGGKDGTGGDKFHQKTVAFAGLDKIWERLALTLCAASDIPMVRLFGTSPGGMNATGKGEQENYDDHIAAEQKAHLAPQLNWGDEILIRSTLGKMPENYSRTFNPLRQMTEKEKAEIGKLQMETLQIGIDAGFVTEHLAARQTKAWGMLSAMEKDDVDVVEEMMLEPDPVPAPLPPANGAPPKKPPVEPGADA